MGKTANVYRVSFDDNENVLKLIMVMGAQFCKFIKITEFALKVGELCELYIKLLPKKRQTETHTEAEKFPY